MEFLMHVQKFLMSRRTAVLSGAALLGAWGMTALAEAAQGSSYIVDTSSCFLLLVLIGLGTLRRFSAALLLAGMTLLAASAAFLSLGSPAPGEAPGLFINALYLAAPAAQILFGLNHFLDHCPDPQQGRSAARPAAEAVAIIGPALLAGFLAGLPFVLKPDAGLLALPALVLPLTFGFVSITLFLPVLAEACWYQRSLPLLIRPTLYSGLSVFGVVAGLQGYPLTGAVLVLSGLYKIGEPRLKPALVESIHAAAHWILAAISVLLLLRVQAASQHLEFGWNQAALLLLLAGGWWLTVKKLRALYTKTLRPLLDHRYVLILPAVLLVVGWLSVFLMSSPGPAPYHLLIPASSVVGLIIVFNLLGYPASTSLILLAAVACAVAGAEWGAILLGAAHSPANPWSPPALVAMIATLSALVQFRSIGPAAVGDSIEEIRRKTLEKASGQIEAAFLPVAVGLGLSLFLFTGTPVLAGTSPETAGILLFGMFAVLINVWLVPVLIAWHHELQHRKQDVMHPVYESRKL